MIHTFLSIQISPILCSSASVHIFPVGLCGSRPLRHWAETSSPRGCEVACARGRQLNQRGRRGSTRTPSLTIFTPAHSLEHRFSRELGSVEDLPASADPEGCGLGCDGAGADSPLRMSSPILLCFKPKITCKLQTYWREQ